MRRLLVLLLLPVALHAAAADKSKYQGFTIDDSRLRDAPNLDEILSATREQIDLVIAVGLPGEMLSFFRGVPFTLVPRGALAPGNPGLYSGRGDRSVSVTSVITTAGHKPVLLHELLHAYHDQRIKGGFDNRDIIKFYRQAKSRGAFAAKSHMMSNEKEYFACAATAYLFGVTAQEPFDREKVKAGQPEFFQYLQQLFGPTTGTYAGSLAR